MSHERHVISNRRSFDCLFNSLYGPTSKEHQSLHYWLFVRGDRWIPRTKGQSRPLMTSSYHVVFLQSACPGLWEKTAWWKSLSASLGINEKTFGWRVCNAIGFQYNMHVIIDTSAHDWHWDIQHPNEFITKLEKDNVSRSFSLYQVTNRNIIKCYNCSKPSLFWYTICMLPWKINWQ